MNILGEPVVILAQKDYEALLSRARILTEIELTTLDWQGGTTAYWFYMNSKLGFPQSTGLVVKPEESN